MKTRLSGPARQASDDAAEDTAFTAFLTKQIAAILPESHDRVSAARVVAAATLIARDSGTRPVGRFPMFECHTCRRYFSRTVGTPFGEKHLKKLDLFVSLLSRPISCVDAGERMGSLSTDIGKRVMAWRTWLSQIDPIGEWKRRVRLDGRPTEPNSEPLVFSRDRSERRGTQLVRLPLY